MIEITDEMVQMVADEMATPHGSIRHGAREIIAAVYPLIEKQVREECAKECDAYAAQHLYEYEDAGHMLAARIRALGEKP